MSGPKGWQEVQDEVLARIRDRRWPPGSAIPNEADLARDFGVARATVNRALQALAEAGWLDRRRRAGTRVALHPVRRATLSIPIIRAEIEGAGHVPGYRLLRQEMAQPPAPVAAALGLTGPLLHLSAVHTADKRPFVIEDRWVNPAAAPGIREADFAAQSANEWLIVNAPFSHGDIALAAAPATVEEAALLACAPGAALFTVTRTTWAGAQPITWVRLAYGPGYAMKTAL
ncbi:MAG: UTRA domain-containing protein [Limimaricola sp.]|uniref:GntR family transcriptional regulator n=1 Tax=Limimaricola sp. TaxID=2211665 RepID=UPI001DF2C0AD|nr:GntR family transcriptional regulator [Limimaricola sp.]MBI1416425.1 UTRA domain-containing protein [Limimaricola sp.]